MMDDDDDIDDNLDDEGDGGAMPRGRYTADDSGLMDQSGMYGGAMDDEDGYDDTQAFDDEDDGGEEQLPDW